MGKRNSGEGGFFHDENRGIWIYQIRYTDIHGNRKRKKFAAKTKREAMEKGQDFLGTIKRGVSEDKVNLNVGTWVEEWLTTIKPHIRPRTHEKYASCLRGYIVPEYKELPLKGLNPSDLHKHFATLLNCGRADGAGLSTSTVRATRRYFCMCLDDAVKVGLITVNPVRATKPPKLTKKEIVVLTKDELENLVEAAKNINHPYMSVMMPELIELTAHTGLRQGEVFGLKWSDVDFTQGAIFVQRSLAHIIGQGAVFQDPKTKNSRRRVLLLPEDVCSLRKYHEWQTAYADKLGDQFFHHGLVFAGVFGNPISPTNFNRRYFRPLLKICGIDENFTFHGLRHTHATLLLKQGVNPKIVQERLGHSSIKVTMDTYSHVLPDMQRQAVDAMEKIFSK